MTEKNYIKGWAREVETQYGNLFNIRINVNQLGKLPCDDEWYVSITMYKIKEPKEKGYTHYFVENTYNKAKEANKKSAEELKKDQEDLPF